MKPRPMKIPRSSPLPPPGDYKYIAVDFDGTLFETEFPDIKMPKMEVFNWCLEHKARGAKIILHTCRESYRLDAAIAACKRYGLEFDAVNENPFTSWAITDQSRKPYADIYLDDKAWRV